MVQIVVKNLNVDQFLYQCSLKDSNDRIIRELVKIWNLRLKLEYLTDILEELNLNETFSVRKIEEKLINNNFLEKKNPDTLKLADMDNNFHLKLSQAQNCSTLNIREMLKNVVREIRHAISVNQLKNSVPLSIELLEEKLSMFRGAVNTAFSKEFLKNNPISIAFEDRDDLVDCLRLSQLNPDTAEMWWASKKFVREETIEQRVGKNEKTKILVILQSPDTINLETKLNLTEKEAEALIQNCSSIQRKVMKPFDDTQENHLQPNFTGPILLKKPVLGKNSFIIP